MTHYVVTTKAGNQYRVPNHFAAQETFAARGGVQIEAVELTNARQQGHAFKPKGESKWFEWPTWEKCND